MVVLGQVLPVSLGTGLPEKTVEDSNVLSKDASSGELV
jgi:hypothetical protein